MKMGQLRIALGLAVAIVLASCGSSDDAAYGGKTQDSVDGGAPNAYGAAVDGGEAAESDAAVAPESGASNVGGPPKVPIGAPIQAPDGQWTEVDFPEGYCRDGEKAHLMAHLNSHSKKMAIYLEGGGACFNDASCKLLTIDLPSYVLGQGIFNFKNPRNPIADWNIFYVPYCSGDVHAGSNPAGKPGPITGAQNYTGYSNLQLYLSRILGTVPDATDALLTGSSAGGVGAGLTASLFARNAPATVERLTLLDDSGPPLSSEYIQPCLQDLWRNVWGFDKSFLEECGAACPKPNDWVTDWIQYLLDTYLKGPNGAKVMGGLLSWSSDLTMRTFYGFGANKCTTTAPVPLGAPQFEAGLLDFRSLLKTQTTQFGTYYAAGNAHTFLMLDSSGLIQGKFFVGGLYDTVVNGVKLTDWISDLLAHKQAPHVGP
jgi:hypothetical protein